MKLLPDRRKLTQPTLAVAFGVGFFVAGVSLGTKQLGDNSFFTHLATGHIIWDTHSVPTTDPYTFTAFGQPWVVQSWLASIIYAGLENSFGLVSIRFLHAGLAGLAGLGIWHLTRAIDTLIPRLAVATLTFAICSPGWVERPLMFGFLGFLALLLLTYGSAPTCLAIPIMWFWVNTHGSFPIGVLIIGAIFVGQALDKSNYQRVQKLFTFTVAGTLLGGIVSPLYGKILIFPVLLLERNSHFQNIMEWKSPDFSNLWMKLFLLQILLVVVALPALKARRWERTLPLSIALAAGLLGTRNVTMAALVMTLPLVDVMPNWGALRGSNPGAVALPVLLLAPLGILGSGYYLSKSDDLDLKKYPVDAIAYLENQGLLPNPNVRIAYGERVGNYLNYRYGPKATTFFDDRFDMYELETLDDMFDLSSGVNVFETLEDYKIEYVLWADKSAVATILTTSSGWQEVVIPLGSTLPGSEKPDSDDDHNYRLFKRNS